LFRDHERVYRLPNSVIDILRNLPAHIPRNRPPNPKPDCAEFDPCKF
jgi:hypothetical protein